MNSSGNKNYRSTSKVDIIAVTNNLNNIFNK